MSELVSIVVPVYNVERYLAECLDSILGQTYSNIEVIVVDDGSTDNSYAICQEYSRKDQRIVLVQKENGGLSSARNAGLARMTGSYVGFVDSDDTIDSTMIEKMMHVFQNSDTDIVIGGFERYDDRTGDVYSREMLDGKWETLSNNDLGEMLYVNPGVWNKLYRAELFEKVAFTEVSLAEDLIFLIDILKEKPRIARVREILYHYRVRDNSIINTVKESAYQELLDILVVKREQIAEVMAGDRIESLIDAIMFLHIGVSLTFRLIQGNRDKTSEYIKNARNILDRHFPTWRKSEYLSLAFGLHKGIKGIGIWGCRLLYKWNLFVIFVKFYRFIQEKLHVDIKW